MAALLFILLTFVPTLEGHARPTLSSVQMAQARAQMALWWPESARFADDVLTGEVVSWAHSEAKGKTQTLKSRVVGLHPRSCAFGLRKISLYESYPKHLSFITQASYDEAKQKVRFVLEHTLLPFPMVLAFTIPRIRGPGTYPFTFPDGIFKDLKGVIHVAAVGARCLYHMQAEWEGAHTGIPSPVVGTFAQTLNKLGLDHLIRVSSL